MKTLLVSTGGISMQKKEKQKTKDNTHTQTSQKHFNEVEGAFNAI